MILKKPILLICLLIPLLATSQNGYPKLTKINNETFALFTVDQARQLDAYRIEFKREATLRKFYENRLQECDSLVFEFQKLDKDQKDLISDYQKLDKANTNIINSLMEVNSGLKYGTEKLEKKLGISSTLAKIFCGAFLVALGLLFVQ